MLSDDAIRGLQSAPPEKRYKSFLNTVTDFEEVWLVSSDDGYVTYDFDGFVHVLIWLRKELCEYIISDNEYPMSIEIHEFLGNCKTLDNSIRFMAFPTTENSYIVSATQLCLDIEAHLAELE